MFMFGWKSSRRSRKPRPSPAPESVIDLTNRSRQSAKNPVTVDAVLQRQVDAAFVPTGSGPDHPDFPIEVADTVIKRLFASGVGLAACADVVPGPSAHRLVRLIDDLDDIILDLRRAAL